MTSKTHIAHADFVAALTRGDFLAQVAAGEFQIIREVACNDLTLINLYRRFKGPCWAIQQGDAVHVYSTEAFWARINALADVSVRFAVEIRRAINTDFQHRTIGPRHKRTRVVHAAEGRAVA